MPFIDALRYGKLAATSAQTVSYLQASGEKVQALMRVSQAEQTAEQAFEETGNLLDQVADLKDKVAKVCTAALMPQNIREEAGDKLKRF